MAQYADYFILTGLALCVLSVIYAVIQLVQLQPPRAAAIMLILGIALLFAGALVAPQAFTVQDIRGAWGRVIGQTDKAVLPADDKAVGGN